MSGFTPKLTPVSSREAAQMQSAAHVKTVVKNALARFIGSFFQEDGKNRHYTKNLFPGVLNLVADENFVDNAEAQADNKVKFPIFKSYNDIQSYLPCLVIADTGIQYKQAGLGFDQGNYRLAPKTVYRVVEVLRTVNITLMVATGDQTTTESIVDAMSMIFGDIAGITSGMALTDPSGQAHWIIRFPKLPELGSSESRNQGEDAKDQIWTSTTNLPIEYEDAFLVPFEEPNYQIQAASPASMPKLAMHFPSRIRVGLSTPGIVVNLGVANGVTVSDPSIVSLRPGSIPGQYFMLARRPGSFTIRVVGGSRGDNPGGGVRPDVLAELLVTASY